MDNLPSGSLVSSCTCLVGLGANLGDRAATLEAAVSQLTDVKGVEVLAKSPWRSSQAIGGPAGQGEFLNGAALLRVALDPFELLDALRSIEMLHGRERHVRWAARTLDLDLLLFDDLVIDDKVQPLQVPHPRMTYRPFVIGPAAEAAPEMRHPQLDATLAEIDRQLHEGEDRIVLQGGTESQRIEVREILAGFDHQPVEISDNEPLGNPKLQILFDRQSTPLRGVPALWLQAEEPPTWRSELAAALECVWPSSAGGEA